MFPTVGDRLLRALAVGFIILPLIGTVAWGWVTWREARAEAAIRAEISTGLLREYMLRLVQTQVTLLDAADARTAGLSDADFTTRNLQDFLARIDTNRDRSAGLGYISAAGRFVVSSRAYPAVGDVSDRTYFTAIRDGAELYIDRLVTRPDGEDVLVVATRRRGDGFKGLFVSSIFVEDILPFLERIAHQSGDVASLVRSDGTILVRNVPGPTHTIRADSPMREIIVRGGDGVFETVASIDGVRRLYAVSQVADLPVFANFGISTSRMISTWLSEFLPKGLFLVLLGGLGFAASIQASRRVRADRERMVAVFRQREAEKVADVKDRMLRELNHRVKNNLQSIEALIRLRLRRSPNVELEDVAQRVWAISEVHDLLYNSPDNQLVDFADFVRAIGSNAAIVPPESGVSVMTDTVPVKMDITTATPVALVLVEIVTNALKHAFAGREHGEIRITLRREADTAVVTVADDGVGLPAETSRRSGLRLVEGMLDQVGGRIEAIKGNGTTFAIRFPVTD